MFASQRGCTNLLKGDTRPSRANMTERSYQKIFCSNMMKTNQDIMREGLTEQTVDIFMENSGFLFGLRHVSCVPSPRSSRSVSALHQQSSSAA